MLVCVIALAAVITLLGMIVYYLFPNTDKTMSTIPGLEPVNKLEGNFPDVASAGSLHEFLVGLHETYGPIARFWWGPQMVVSIGSTEMCKGICKLFDRPVDIFSMLLPLIGEGSIQFTNGEDGKMRHAAYSKCFSSESMKQHFEMFNKVSSEVLSDWNDPIQQERIPLREFSMAFAIKTLLRGSMGTYFDSETNIKKIFAAYLLVWTELENRLRKGMPEDHSDRIRGFEEQKEILYSIAKEIWEHRRENPPGAGEFMLIDAIIELDLTENKTFSDIITTLIASFHTTGLLLTWTIYFMAIHPDVQEKLYNEALSVLGGNPVDYDNMKQLTYMQQVLNESLRCSVLAPFAARVGNVETELGGHKVPGKTPILISLGTILKDPTVYPDPDKFDPGRFSPGNASKQAPFAFEPFGFAGKRKCPGYRFSLTEASVLLADIVRKFEITLVESQFIVPVYGLMTTPNEEIWLAVKRRV